MAEKMESINPSMLKWARTVSGTNLEEIGEKFGGVEKILEWEEGRDFPTYSQLKKILEAYRKPIAIAFFPEPPKLKNIPASCRTIPENIYDSLSLSLIKVIDEARVMQLNLYELNDNNNPSKIKFTDLKFDYKHSKKVAFQIRELFEVDLKMQKKIKKLEKAFELWRDCFYKLGIYVFKSAFHDDSVSGFCLYDNEFPIIYINNSFAPARQIFTLFHELYHLVCHTSGIDLINDKFLNTYDNKTNVGIERTCNRFAGEFLVPDDDFDIIIKNVPLNDGFVKKLAETYSVSREVILRKFLDKGKISSEEYKIKRDEFNSDYFRAKEAKKEGQSRGDYYNTQAVYKGRHYLELSYGKYFEKKISITQLSQYLNMKIPSIEALAAKKGWGELH